MLTKQTLTSVFCGLNLLLTPNLYASSNTITIYGLEKGSRLELTPNQGKEYIVQLGSFIDQANANRYRKSIAERVDVPVQVIPNERPQGTYFAVVMGPFTDPRQLSEVSHALLSGNSAKTETRVAARETNNTVAYQPQKAGFTNDTTRTTQNERNIAPKVASLSQPNTFKQVAENGTAPTFTATDAIPPIPQINDTAPQQPVATTPSNTNTTQVTTGNNPSTNVTYDSLHKMAYSGQSEQAIELAEEYLKHNENSSIRVLLARMLLWDKQYDAAREQLQFVLAKSPGNYDACDTLADVDVWTDNYSHAIEVIDTALKYHPNDEYFLDKRQIISTKLLIANGQRSEAIQSLSTYVTQHPSVTLRMYLGSLYLSDKRYDEAGNQFQTILNQDPNNIEAIDELAEVEIAKGNYQKAEDIIDSGLQKDPNNQELLKNRSYVLKKQRNPSEEPKVYTPPSFESSGYEKPAAEKSTPKAPENKNEITYEKIKKLSDSGQRKKAIELAREYLKTNENSDVRILLGLMLSWDKQYNEARMQLTTVLKKKPDNAEASAALANVEIWSNNPKQALVVVDNGLKYHPKDKTLLKQKDDLLDKTISYAELNKMARSDQKERAKVLAQQYLQKHDNADVRVLLGLMLSWDKNYVEAKNQFQTVLNSKPGYTDASNALADINIWNEDYQQALNIVNAALKYHPGNADLLKKRADIMQKINETSLRPGLFNLANAVGPSTAEGKLNAIQYNHETAYVDDLDQYWQINSFAYERYTKLGPIIFTVNETKRFNTNGRQYLVEAYPHLFPGAYAYVAYGQSSTSYLARNYYAIEPFFSLPNAYELSLGERILKFNSITHLYTGSVSKYIGNYWFSLRPFLSAGRSQSYFLTARRYYSTPDTYVSLTLGTGNDPSGFDLNNPNGMPISKSRSIRINGNYAISNTFIITWLARKSKDEFPNARIRHETDGNLGFIWRF